MTSGPEFKNSLPAMNQSSASGYKKIDTYLVKSIESGFCYLQPNAIRLSVKGNQDRVWKGKVRKLLHKKRNLDCVHTCPDPAQAVTLLVAIDHSRDWTQAAQQGSHSELPSSLQDRIPISLWRSALCHHAPTLVGENSFNSS